MFPVNFPKNASKQHKSIDVAHFEEKNSFVNIVPFYWFDQKKLFKKSKFSSGFSPFMLRKTYFLSISELLSDIVSFLD